MTVCEDYSLEKQLFNANIVVTGKVTQVIREEGPSVQERKDEDESKGFSAAVPQSLWADSPGLAQQHHVKIDRVFKGEVSQEVVIYSATVVLKKGEEYLIFARQRNGRFEVFGRCGDVTPLSEAAEAIHKIEEILK